VIIHDRVYGRCDVEDQLILDIMASKPLQRLKGINQAGASQYAIKGKDISRYEHSVGVMLLLRRLGASQEEQIAGLIHDIPHTAFSHVIDFVFKSSDHSYHEKHMERVFWGSEIPGILQAGGIEPAGILDESRFGLLERKIPDLCADRLDYTFRDVTAYNGEDAEVRFLLTKLAVSEGEIVMADADSAWRLALLYLHADYTRWSDPKEIALFQILGDAIRIALDEGTLVLDDLFKDDKHVMDKLRMSKDKQILEKLGFLSPDMKVIPDKEGIMLHNKVRYIDPLFIREGKLIRTSELFPAVKEQIEKHNQKIRQGFRVKISI